MPNQAWLKIVKTTKAITHIKRVLKREEEIKSIDWFNFGFRDDPSWEDKSKGKGCDIEVQTNLRNIKTIRSL